MPTAAATRATPSADQNESNCEAAAGDVVGGEQHQRVEHEDEHEAEHERERQAQRRQRPAEGPR